MNLGTGVAVFCIGTAVSFSSVDVASAVPFVLFDFVFLGFVFLGVV